MPIVAGGVSPPAFGRDQWPRAGVCDVGPGLVGIVAAIRQKPVEPTAYSLEQRSEAPLIVGLPRRQAEGERETARVTTGVEFGREAAARSSERLDRASAFLIPAAQ